MILAQIKPSLLSVFCVTFYFLSLIFFFLRLASFCEPHLVFGQIVLSSSIECLFKLVTLTSRPAQKRAHLLSCLPFHPLRILR